MRNLGNAKQAPPAGYTEEGLRGERVVYTAKPSGQAEASLTSTEISDSGFTVENLQHDLAAARPDG